MSTYAPEELRRYWSQGSLTLEQAIGHILQHIKRLSEEQQRLARSRPDEEHTPPGGQPPAH